VPIDLILDALERVEPIPPSPRALSQTVRRTQCHDSAA
jgi:hypothetical protein